MRGLLVDYGGVLTTSVFASFADFCAAEGLAPDRVVRLFLTDPGARDLLYGLEEGSLPEDAFEDGLATLLGVSADGLIGRLMASTRPDEGMIAVVRQARAHGIRTGLVSNSWGLDWYDHELLGELFDGVVLSGAVGIRKPAPEIYRMGAESVGLPPGECAFVDDLGGNLKPAQALGMATVRHETTDRTVAALERLFGVDLSSRPHHREGFGSL
jgi:epoxide hydrolase-like predicted phosphatase